MIPKYVTGAYGDQQRKSDTLKIKLQIIRDYYVGSKN